MMIIGVEVVDSDPSSNTLLVTSTFGMAFSSTTKQISLIPANSFWINYNNFYIFTFSFSNRKTFSIFDKC